MRNTTPKDDYNEEKNQDEDEESICSSIAQGDLDDEKTRKTRLEDEDDGTLLTLDDSKSTLQSFPSAVSLDVESDVPAILLATQHKYYSQNTQCKRRPRPKKKGKQGHVFLFCLCDVRRAVILINMLTLFGSCFGTVIMVKFWLKMKDAGRALRDDDFLMNPYDNVMPVLYNYFILTVFCVVFSTMAIAGATYYNAWLVGANAFFIIAATTSTIVTSCVTAQRVSSYEYAWYDIVVTVAVAMLFCYPNLMLTHEIETGIISSTTYRWRERRCCFVNI